MEIGGAVYIMTNVNRTTLYIGVTSDLLWRIKEHREKVYPRSFTAKYNLSVCVYYEIFSSIEEAINREKEIKKWRREKKDFLINNMNPNWRNLWEDIKNW
ncbi:GIY-YIG nuclease family protein [Sphingobacterium sp. SGG-5]|uniref:GIY-YIG nuclease family protein n=1 Tax=Sphingobacterium sp. SGG-5 TaxID=2710881 RepID=UPI0013EDC3F0|nr:GIY-YIG nuclease family protein [Sphingobacterium sp. SGG-5]NGM60520.1 GIY-YIG nuclease family protein [Sphingobacterium sp. SGG-5]